MWVIQMLIEKYGVPIDEKVDWKYPLCKYILDAMPDERDDGPWEVCSRALAVHGRISDVVHSPQYLQNVALWTAAAGAEPEPLRSKWRQHRPSPEQCINELVQLWKEDPQMQAKLEKLRALIPLQPGR